MLRLFVEVEFVLSTGFLLLSEEIILRTPGTEFRFSFIKPTYLE